MKAYIVTAVTLFNGKEQIIGVFDRRCEAERCKAHYEKTVNPAAFPMAHLATIQTEEFRRKFNPQNHKQWQ